MTEYEALIEALKATGIPFEEDAWYVGKSPLPAAPFGAYAIDGSADTLWAGDQLRERALQGTVDLFTRGRGRDTKAKVEEALGVAEISWRLNSQQYEADTRLMHFEWVFEVAE